MLNGANIYCSEEVTATVDFFFNLCGGGTAVRFTRRVQKRISSRYRVQYIYAREARTCSVRHAEKIKGGTTTKKRPEGERDGGNFTAERLSDLECVRICTYRNTHAHTHIYAERCTRNYLASRLSVETKCSLLLTSNFARNTFRTNDRRTRSGARLLLRNHENLIFLL